jgi:hypothetical protein
MNNLPTYIPSRSTKMSGVTGNSVQCPQISATLSLTSNLLLKKVTDLLADASPVTDLLVRGDVTTTLYKYNSGDEIAKAQYSFPPWPDPQKLDT